MGNITVLACYEGRCGDHCGARSGLRHVALPIILALPHEQLADRPYEPAPPAAAALSAWEEARSLAQQYWTVLAGDARLSAPFRLLCGRCLETLRALSVRGLC